MNAAPPYPTSNLFGVISRHLEENKLKLYETAEVDDLEKTLMMYITWKQEALKVISQKDTELEKIKDVNLKLQEQLKIQNQWFIRRWTETVISSGKEQGHGQGQMDIESGRVGGVISEDEIMDKNMTQIMKRLQTRVIQNGRERVKEIQGLQVDKRILLRNQSRLLGLIQHIAEFSEYPHDPDQFQDHEERRLVSQKDLLMFGEYLKKKIGNNDDGNAGGGGGDSSTSAATALENLKRLDGEKRRDTANDMNLLIDENEKLLRAQVNLVNFVQDIATISGYQKKFHKNFNANDDLLEKGNLDKLYCHVENVWKRGSPGGKVPRKRLTFEEISVPEENNSSEGHRSEQGGPPPRSPPKAKSPTPPPPPPPVNQPMLPSPPKITCPNVKIAEGKSEGQNGQPDEKESDDSVQLNDSPGDGDNDQLEAWFACEPCKMEFEFVKDLKEHHVIFHDNENDGQLLGYFDSDTDTVNPRLSTASAAGGLQIYGFKKLRGCSVRRRVVVVADEEEMELEVEPTGEPLKKAGRKKKQRSEKPSASSSRPSASGKRKISRNVNKNYHYYGNWKKDVNVFV